MSEPLPRNPDAEHLQLLTIFHYIGAGLAGLLACLPLLHLVFGIVVVAYGDRMTGDKPPAFVGWLFIVVASGFILFGWAFAAVLALGGRYLSRRRHHTFCLVAAGVACLFMPFGTILGVCTIIVLMRPSVKSLFGPAPIR